MFCKFDFDSFTSSLMSMDLIWTVTGTNGWPWWHRQVVISWSLVWADVLTLHGQLCTFNLLSGDVATASCVATLAIAITSISFAGNIARHLALNISCLVAIVLNPLTHLFDWSQGIAPPSPPQGLQLPCSDILRWFLQVSLCHSWSLVHLCTFSTLLCGFWWGSTDPRTLLCL